MSKNKLDQYYTNKKYAKYVLDIVSKKIQLNKYDILFEPSAGTGSFYNLLDNKKRIGIDLEPKCKGIIKKDFFEYDYSKLKGKVLTIGNPPFGKNSSLAVKFFNTASKFSDTIAFIIPRTFNKASIQSKLNSKFHLLFNEDVPDNSFIYNEKEYNVWCCFQIWVKKSYDRKKQKRYSIKDVKNYFKLTNKDNSDFAIQRVGNAAGKIKNIDYKKYAKASHYFIKSNNSTTLNTFKKCNFDNVKYNTVGNPSISISELIDEFLKRL